VVSFDRVAPHYCWLETIAFGTALQRARTFFIGEATTAKRVLIVGEGNGRFLLELLRDSEAAQIDCVDSSAVMLDLARQQLARYHPEAIGRVRFIRSTIEDWPLPDFRYDLIVTHFVLDCFPPQPLEAVVAKLAQAATPAATWLLADFDYPATPARRLHARLWIAAMYLFFRTIADIEARSLVDPSLLLQSHGFVCRQRKEFYREMVKTEVWTRRSESGCDIQ
jgi:ubiquinone/menaquinone biosynthesis C-methylase UbiE